MAEAPKSVDLDIWRVIPPEEKIEMMSRAQTAGTMACIAAVIALSTVSIALRLDWILWSSLIACPFIFQFAAGKVWRDLKPRTMLEYLAARSAARRFAFMYIGKKLGLNLIFRGQVEKLFEQEQVMEQLEAAVNKNSEAAVWIALFEDSVVLISEQPGGAKAQFAHLINEKMEVYRADQESGSDAVAPRSLVLKVSDSRGTGSGEFKLTSRHPAALLVFEKKLLQALQNQRNEASSAATEPDEDSRVFS
jgi:hypothetical protein